MSRDGASRSSIPRDRSPESFRAARLRSPLLIVVGGLLAVEAIGGLALFVARLVLGRYPGETIHVVAGLGLTLAFVLYQWRHWLRVAPLRARQDYILGLIASTTMALTLLSGLWLGIDWWRARTEPTPTATRYDALLVAIHNIGGMLVLAFVGAHLGAVLMRDSSREP